MAALSPPCFSDSSKELEELRSAFGRAIKYLKHNVEERRLRFI